MYLARLKCATCLEQQHQGRQQARSRFKDAVTVIAARLKINIEYTRILGGSTTTFP